MFDRFYRVSETRQADGFGLYITRKLVKAHGGQIGAESEPGKGSTFYFTMLVA